MKNTTDDKYDKLPIRESRWQSLLTRGWNMYDLRFDHSWMRFKKYWELADRMIEANIGRSFDKTFSKYCKKVPKLEQYWFLKEFGQKWSTYYVDKNKCIQKYKKRSKNRV